MLQRIQTVWLFLASLAIFALFFFPSLHYISASGSEISIRATGIYELRGVEVVKSQEFIPLTVATVVVGLLPLVLIFQFGHRKRQIMLSYATVAIIIAFGYWVSRQTQGVVGPVKLDASNFGLGSVLPTFAILFVILATRAINKDEKLVKSADRLR